MLYSVVIHLLEILTIGGHIEGVGVLATVILKFTGLFSQIGAVVHCCELRNTPVVFMMANYWPALQLVVYQNNCAVWSYSSDTWKKWECNEAVHQKFIDFKKAYDAVRKLVLYNILIDFGIPMKLVRVIKMCLNETYSRVQVGKNLSDMFPIRNALK